MKDRTKPRTEFIVAAILLALMILYVVILSICFVRQDFPVCLHRQGLEVPAEGSFAYNWAFVLQCADVAARILSLMGAVLGLLMMVIDLVKPRGRSFVLHPSVGLLALLYGAMQLLISLPMVQSGLSLLTSPWPALLVFYRPAWKFGAPVLVSWFGVNLVTVGLLGKGFPPTLLAGMIILVFTVLHFLWHRHPATCPPSTAGALRGVDEPS
jgi:hypothetical protein